MGGFVGAVGRFGGLFCRGVAGVLRVVWECGFVAVRGGFCRGGGWMGGCCCICWGKWE